MEYEISFLSWDSRYFWSGALKVRNLRVLKCAIYESKVHNLRVLKCAIYESKVRNLRVLKCAIYES